MKKTAIKKAANLLSPSNQSAPNDFSLTSDKGLKNLWWVPDDIQVFCCEYLYNTEQYYSIILSLPKVWSLAYATSGELPNGLINFETVSNGKTVSFPKHRHTFGKFF